MRLKYVGFTFENCEQIEIDGKYIGDFCISDIKTSYQRIAINCISEVTRANSIIVEIHKDANKPQQPIWSDKKEDAFLPFTRLTEYSDITYVDFALEDDFAENQDGIYPVTEYSFSVDYKEDVKGQLGAENLNQKTYTSKCGNLYLVIEKDKEISDCFTSDSIDDEEYTDVRFDLMDFSGKVIKQINRKES